jgi:amino acid permease
MILKKKWREREGKKERKRERKDLPCSAPGREWLQALALLLLLLFLLPGLFVYMVPIFISPYKELNAYLFQLALFPGANVEDLATSAARPGKEICSIC